MHAGCFGLTAVAKLARPLGEQCSPVLLLTCSPIVTLPLFSQRYSER